MLHHYLPSNLATPYLVSEWVIRIAMLFFVPTRRTPQAAQAWLLLIFFLPIPGVILYMAIGRPRFPRWRTERFHRLVPFFGHVSARLAEAGAVPERNEVAMLAERLGALPATQGNGIALLPDYDEAIDRLIADVEAAQESVRIVTYIFADDPVGSRMIDALCRAAGRGVVCHVLIDAFGSHRWSRRVLARLNQGGVDARKALPFRLVHRRTRNDMRNHRKLAVIDGRIGYAGSQNIVGKAFRAGIVNRELVARLTGPIVAEMDAVIVGDWYLETEKMLEAAAVPPPDGDARLQLLPSGADYPLEGFETLLVWQLHKAERRAVVVTPYLVPDEDVLGAMRTAVARGVAVDLIVSRVADQKLVSLAQRSYFDSLLSAGVSVYRFRSFLLHAKNVSIDDSLAIIGSSNVDLRSFQLNDEVSLLLHDSESIRRLEAIQRDYRAQSDPLSLEEWRARPRGQKVLESLARLVGPLL
jgi:cardiolipin synthase